MAIAYTKAVYDERVLGREGMERGALWQGQAGSLFGLNQVYADPGLAQATTTTAVKTTNSAQYLIGGIGKTKAATDNLWALGVAGSNTTVAVSSFQKYALLVDDAGAATVQEATQNTVSLATVSWSNVIANAKGVPVNPWAAFMAMVAGTKATPLSKSIFGILSIATDATHTFIPGTTALNATGITATFTWSIEPQLFPLIYNTTGLLLGVQI